MLGCIRKSVVSWLMEVCSSVLNSGETTCRVLCLLNDRDVDIPHQIW